MIGWEKGEQLLVAQNPKGRHDLQVTSRRFYKMHGFDVFHEASTDCGSSGSPIMMCHGEVISIHKGALASEDEHCYFN